MGSARGLRYREYNASSGGNRVPEGFYQRVWTRRRHGLEHTRHRRGSHPAAHRRPVARRDRRRAAGRPRPGRRVGARRGGRRPVEDATAALDAAVRGPGGWAATAPRERGELLRAAYELVAERTEQFARVISLEMGKPLAEARGEVAYGASSSAGSPRRRCGSTAAGWRPRRRRPAADHEEPVGPCLFDHALELPARDGHPQDRPGLAAGCTMVVKPAAQTPLTMLRWPRCSPRSACPAGVLNVDHHHARRARSASR